jgi:hypothetical protein
MDKLEIKQGSFIQQTQYFIPVEIDLSVVPTRLGIWFFHLSRRTTVIQDLLVRRQFSLVPDNRTNVKNFIGYQFGAKFKLVFCAKYDIGLDLGFWEILKPLKWTNITSFFLIWLERSTKICISLWILIKYFAFLFLLKYYCVVIQYHTNCNNSYLLK